MEWMREKLGEIEKARNYARNGEDESIMKYLWVDEDWFDEIALNRCVPPTSFWLILETLSSKWVGGLQTMSIEPKSFHFYNKENVIQNQHYKFYIWHNSFLGWEQ